MRSVSIKRSWCRPISQFLAAHVWQLIFPSEACERATPCRAWLFLALSMAFVEPAVTRRRGGVGAWGGCR